MLFRIRVHFSNGKFTIGNKIHQRKSNVRDSILFRDEKFRSVNHWKPKAEWRTENFEDHRRFNPRATLKYDLMQIIPNYDPKMDGLFNPHEVDTFHEMKKHEIVKVLRFVVFKVNDICET